MIHVTWQPGTYGSYIMQSIYAYSNLGNDYNFSIDTTGSSHDFRDSNLRKKYFICDHECAKKSDVCIIGNITHGLDYLNNQFTKHDTNNIFKSIEKSFPNEFEAKFKLWPSVANWVIREWISFWIKDNIKASYSQLPHADIIASDLFNTDLNIFPEIINRLGLTVTVNDATMKYNQSNWIKQQRYHNSQHRCNKWVQDIVKGIKSESPCQTILDEAYVQHCLREQGYEIRCDGLDIFPKNSSDLRELVYENRNTNNQ
jgi:hypothetical protein